MVTRQENIIERGSDLSALLARSNARIGNGRRLASISFNLWLARRSMWGFTQRIGRRALRKVNEAKGRAAARLIMEGSAA
jgi:hypothetical protein